MENTHDIIVVSDLHIGRGKNAETGRFYRLEAFFYDDDFARFCDHLIEESRKNAKTFKLILNGDTFDLLRIDHDKKRDQKQRERRYGPKLTPDVAADVMAMILEGHPVFIRALALVLSAGHGVVFLPGNHDIEMQWPSVYQVVEKKILDSVKTLADEETATQAEARLEFHPWFYHEENRIWIEHGCQYDSENAFQYYLRKTLAEQDDNACIAERDMPLGTFFQRYLYNQFGNITFLVPNSRSQVRYFRWLVINRPRLLARVATIHFPFFWQVLRRITTVKKGSVSLLEKCHKAELDRLSSESGLGDKLRTIESFKRIELSSAILAKRAIRRALKIIGFIFLATILSTGLWAFGAHSIGTTSIGAGLKALLFVGLNFGFLVITLVAMMYFLLRPPGPGPDPWLKSTADDISQLIKVPIVTFGHTHDEDISSLSLKENAWYFNTGTWIAVFAADSLLPRERVQYTFLRIQENKGKLVHWSPGRAEIMPVVLIDGDNDPGRERGVAT